jgi:hypothetical protein
VKPPHIVDVHRGQRGFAADRRVPVRVSAVHEFQKGAVGDGAGHVAHLRQPVQPQLPHPREIRFTQRRSHDDVGEEIEGAAREAAEDGDARDRRVRADVGIELRAETRERFVHLDRRTPAAAFVEHVGGDRGEAVLPGRIRRGAAADQQRERHERHLRVAHGPHAEAAGQRGLLDRGKRKVARRAGNGQPLAIHGGRLARTSRHDTAAVVESGAASDSRPCGTMLSVTRRAGSR